ncbi:MAG: proton-conducting transporter membrane subunit, partial [Myxococcota bacterium]
ILAYSTVSQLGFMFAAVGVGAFAAGIFHVYTHAFFKACLFLGAGSVMHAVGAHGDADIRKLGGLRKILPTTHWTFLASTAAIAGVPLLAGFFSKDDILLGAATLGAGTLEGTPFFAFADVQWVGWFVYAVLVAAATMTAFYMFRLYFLTFSGEYRSAAAHAGGEEGAEAAEAHGHEDHGHAYDAHPHESPPSMAVPLMVLAAGAIVAGWLNLEPLHVHFNLWGEWLSGTLAGLDVDAPAAHNAAMAGGLLAAAVGIGGAYVLYVRRKVLPEEELPADAPLLHRLALDKWRVDELYAAVIVRPVQRLALLAGQLDKYAVDMFFTKLTSVAVRAGGWAVTRAQTGLVFAYGAVLVLGIAGVAWWFLYPQIRVETEVDGAEVSMATSPGLGYAYRWDVGADGEYETEWRDDPTFTHTFLPADFHEPVLLIAPAAELGAPPQDDYELALDDGERFTLPERLLGPRWRDGDDGEVRPTVRRDGDRLIVRPNSARMRVDDRPRDDGEVALPYGESVFVGGATVQTGARVRVEVHVRNAFGNSRSKTLDLAVQPSPTPSEPRAALEVHE